MVWEGATDGIRPSVAFQSCTVHPRCKFARENLIGQGTDTCQDLANGRQDSLTDGPRAPPTLHAMGAGWLPRHEWMEPTGKAGDSPCLPSLAGFDQT